MPTPIPLPASCSVDALAEWLRRTVDSDRGNPYYAMAEVVRALVEAKVREAVVETLDNPIPYIEDESFPAYVARAGRRVDETVSRILGTALDADGGA